MATKRENEILKPLRLKSFELSFDPPVWKSPKRKRREVKVMRDDGVILTGIIIHYLNGASQEIHIPEELTIENRPEWLNQRVALCELDRELLRLQIRQESRYRPGTA